MLFRNLNVPGAEPKRQLGWGCPLLEAEEFNSTNFFPYHVLRARSLFAIVMAEFLPPVDSGVYTAKRGNNIVTINELKGEHLCLFSWYDYSGLLKLVRTDTRTGVTVWWKAAVLKKASPSLLASDQHISAMYFCSLQVIKLNKVWKTQ